MANEAMEAAWDGEEGDHWAEHADHYDLASTRVMAAYVPAIGVRPDDRVLDVGCGAGGLALDLAALCPNGSVLGVDLSSQMLDVAAKRAAARGITNVAFEQADAQTHAFVPASFDLAVSSFGCMFFDDPVAAFTNINAALKPGGRVAFIAWQAMQDNPWLMGIRTSLAMGRDLPFPPLEAPTPFALSVPARTASLFEAAGFTDVASTAVNEPMVLGRDTDDAYEFFKEAGIAKGLSHDLDDEQKKQGFANLRQFLGDHETPEGVLVDSAAWIISAAKR
jgi:ubiquinone/menaquinone biosynthesis C-methylase UbiE